MSEKDVVVSVVLPVYNEEKTIKEVVRRVKECGLQTEIIVVDDCSDDRTRLILENELKDSIDQLIYHEKNCGKGAALRDGFLAATGDVVIVQDADMEYDPKEFAKVVEPINRGECDVCYGSRFRGQKMKGYLLNRMANRFLTAFSNLFTRQRLTDMETCYKCFRRNIIQSITIEENRFGVEPEITAKISALGIHIMEVPISYHPRTNKEGKKIGFIDGLRAIYVICKYKKG